MSSASDLRAADSKIPVTFAYSSAWVLDTAPLTTRFYNSLVKQFDAKFPKLTLKLEPIPGTYNDIVTKLSLLFRSRSTSPDVAEMPTQVIGQFQSAGELMAINNFLKTSSWWSTFPKVVQSEGTVGGQVYAVDQGENDEFIYYDKAIFQKAGLPTNWAPKNWAQILSAAEQIKSKVPGVFPMWLYPGNLSGSTGLLQGAANLIYGTSTPDIQVPHSSKFVIQSPGIDAVLKFYHDVYSKGLGVPMSALPSNGGIGYGGTLFQQGKLGLAIGSNYWGGGWTKTVSAPYWPQAPQMVGAAPLPTEFGQSPGIATTIGGWDLAMGAATSHPQYAWDLLNLLQDPQNSLAMANWSGFVPPSSQFGKDPAFVNFASPYNAESVDVLPYGRLIPTSANFDAWAYGFGEATANMALHPSTTVAQALSTFQSYAKNQIGASSLVTEK
jgi:multiple sugar transport system substrate-binding protein